jgi:UDP-glucuronate decarboxylase
MNVLVTGAAGFLGFHLCEKLLADGHSVTGVDNFYTGSRSNRDDLVKNKNFKFVEADILEFGPSQAERLLGGNQKFDRIYHMACPASPPQYQRDQLYTLDVCTTGSRNVFELAKHWKARILIASTSEIYGDPEVHPQPESYRGNVNTLGPRSCYDEGKRVMETLGFIYASQHNVNVRIARIFNTYGPRMSGDDGRVVSNFVCQALKGQDLTVYGDGSQTRSFCYYSDQVAGLNKLMESTETGPVNIGSNREFSVLELAQTVRELSGRKLNIVHLDLPIDDPKIRRPDLSRAKALLNWEPTVALKQGVAEMMEWYRTRI